MNDSKAVEQMILKGAASSDKLEKVQDIRVKVIDVTPYIINITDMETTKFKQAKKRVLINSIKLDLGLESGLTRAQKLQ